MKYSDLVKQVAHEACTSQSTAKQVLDALVVIIPDAVKKGEEVVLNRVGKFSKKTRSARTGFNPNDGKSIEIPAKEVVTFKPAKEFKDHINE